MDLLPLFQWFYQTDIGVTIRNSVWLFPAIEAFHLLGFGLTAGATLVVNLRLLGVGLTKQPVAQLAAGAEPWLIVGVSHDGRVGRSAVSRRSRSSASTASPSG